MGRYEEIEVADTGAERGQEPEMVNRRRSDTRNRVDALTSGQTAIERAQGLLQDIHANANEVSALSLEHRTGSIWNILPVVENVRSHFIAGKEADTIDHIKEDMRDLERLVDEHQLNIDLTQVRKAVENIHKPEGISMWAATLIPVLGPLARVLHRAITPHKGENIRRSASDARRSLSRQRRAAA